MRGLTTEAAERRLASEGPNVIPSEAPRGTLALVWDVVSEPMRLMLVASALVYIPLGETLEASVLASWVGVMVLVDVVQNRRTARALDALRTLASPRARVVRDGAQVLVPGASVVRGDRLVLAEGDRVPADAVLREGHLVCDESLLTGESVPVRKVATAAEGGAPKEPGGEDQPWTWSGSLVVAGRGEADVLATGARSALGQIGARLATIEQERTPLQRELDRVVGRLAALAVVACLCLALALGLQRGDWLQALLAGLALAMSALPEEFPMVMAVFYALGARRMAARRVLPRRVSAVEALGAATILCTDKTGTLTRNQMEVARIGGPEGTERAAGELSVGSLRALTCAVHASDPQPFDPMELALLRLGRARDVTHHGTLLHHWPLAPGMPMVAYAWDGPRRACAKGAAEVVARLCGVELPPEVGELASAGLRVLALAEASLPPGEVPAARESLDWRWAGVVAFEDPLRDEAAAAVRACREAGIRVLMITGDAPTTAIAIALKAGIDEAPRAIQGAELEALEDAALQARLQTVDVVARAVPEHKLRIVKALKASGEVVAMTGDGVNDAPALRAADIGVAMGARGTDVAREAATLVLTDDAFDSLVAGVAEGRRIHDNLRRATAFILAVHVPAVGLSLLPAVTGWPLLLLPFHIAFIELVIDPACSFAFEAEPAERDVMSRPPRDPRASLFTRRMVLASSVHGAAVLIVAVVGFVLGREQGDETGRALAFAALVAGSVALQQVHRHSPLRANPIAALLGVLSLGALGPLLYVPFLRDLFQFATPPLPMLLGTVVASFAAVAVGARLVPIGTIRPAPAGPRASRSA